MKPTQRKDITGLVQFRLTVLSYAGNYSWNCKCRCGNTAVILTSSITRKDKPARSCGKCRDEIKYPKEYNAYTGMHSRCHSIYDAKYEHYGKRGIEVCQRWRLDFFNFLDDMGFAPSSNHTLDRIDVNGNYEPSNCRWATWSEQLSNRRTSIINNI